jgi:hypothetical protein
MLSLHRLCVRELLLLVLAKVVCGPGGPQSSEDVGQYVEESQRKTNTSNLREDGAYETWTLIVCVTSQRTSNVAKRSSQKISKKK